MAWITRQGITIEGGYELLELSKFEIQAAVNQHGRLYLEGTVSEDTAHKLEATDHSGQMIRVLAGGKTLFSGQPERIEIHMFNGCYTLRLEAASFSKLLALVAHDYFYQDTAQSHEEMLRKALERCDGNLIATAGQEPLPAPVLQYQQTAWDFALRTASMLHTVIVPDITASHPQISLGLPDGNSYHVSPTTLEKNIDFLQQQTDGLIEVDRDYSPQEYASCTCKDEQIFHLGDRISVEGDSWAVMSLSHYFTDGVLSNQYRLGDETGFAVPRQNNLIQTGLMLTGTVKAVKGESVQVCLQIPDDAQKGEATWFEYAPVTNNGMYAMPLEGTMVALEWMSPKDGDCKAVRTVRDGTQLSNYEQRSMVTEYGKQFGMMPSLVSFLSDSNRIRLENGIKFKTGGRLKLTAGKSIRIQSDKKVSVRMPQQLFVSIKGIPSNIWMEGRRIHIISQSSRVVSNNRKALTMMPYREVVKPAPLKAGTVMALAGTTPAMTGSK